MNVTNTTWTNIVNTALQNSEIEGADQIQASAVQGASGDLVVSFKGGDGQVYTFTTTMPELDEATGEPTPEAMAALEAKLDKEIKDFEKTLKDFGKLAEELDINENSTGTNKVLFDIYALMTLMLEIAQKQREAARNERKADLDRAVQDIKNQADVQREAATLGLVLGITTSVVSIAAQLGAMAFSAGAANAARKMEANAGATQMSSDLKLLTAPDAAATQKNLGHLEAKMGGTDAVNALKTGEFKSTCEAGTKLEMATTRYNKAVEARDNYVAPPEKMQTDPKLDELNKAVDDAGVDLKQAKIAFQGTADADLTRLDGELAQERMKLNEMTKSDADPQPTKAEIKAQEKKIADLEQKRTWGRAYATDVKMKAGMKESIAADIKSCETIIGQKMEALKLDGEYRRYNSQSDMLAGLGRVAEQLGSMLNNVVHQSSEIVAAGAASHQAESKVHENMQQESDDLAQSAVQLLKSILDLLRQVLEAENQSIRQIVA
ncbi:MAG: type III secretion system translocon subunit SctB [Kiritimatiellia bacterium]